MTFAFSLAIYCLHGYAENYKLKNMLYFSAVVTKTVS